MKKYIVGTVLTLVVAGSAIFFFHPPETGDRNTPASLAIIFRFPEGYEFTPDAPFALAWQIERPDGDLSAPVTEKNFNPLLTPYNLTFTAPPDSKALALHARLFYCDKNTRMCFRDAFHTRVPLPASSYVWEIRPRKTTDQRP